MEEEEEEEVVVVVWELVVVKAPMQTWLLLQVCVREGCSAALHVYNVVCKT